MSDNIHCKQCSCATTSRTSTRSDTKYRLAVRCHFCAVLHTTRPTLEQCAARKLRCSTETLVQYGTTLVLHHNAHTPTMCSTMPQCPHSNNVQHYTTRPTPQQCAESRRLTAPNCDNHQTPTGSRIHPGQVGRSAATSWPDMHMQFRVHVTPSDGRVMLQHMHDPRARHHTVARKPSN